MRKWWVLAVVALLAACASRPSDYNGASAPRAAPIVPLKSDRPLIALALGSGGSRGFAHVGVIKALEEAGIIADIVAGSSSGAVVAALYAAGHDAKSLEELAVAVDGNTLLDFTLFGNGWVLGEALQDFVNGAVGSKPIEKLARPFAVAATRARDGARVIFNRGDTGVAVRASASVPRVFIPPVIRGEEYIDGGLTTPIPVRTARAMGADVVIAVDVSWSAVARANGAYAASDDTTRSRPERHQRLEHELSVADIVIVPRTERTRMLDFGRKLEHIAAGEEAARAAIPRIRDLLARVQLEKPSRTLSGDSASR
ncbi:MAG: patatin-like phospholipase family protein [Betaproteobacteria bacterium]|nr:patatin-like phospholipase family protein [Betaproteobacteria bacterium]